MAVFVIIVLFFKFLSVLEERTTEKPLILPIISDNRISNSAENTFEKCVKGANNKRINIAKSANNSDMKL